MKTLVIVVHPNINESVINKRWIKELNKYPERFVVHQLHQKYPDDEIDVIAEQRLIAQFDKIVFQFPYYWFNCPYLFKKWLDQVLTHGWAYGSRSGYKMQGKKIALAMSLGVEQHELSTSGIYKYPLNELTRPFELSFEYIKADYRPPFAFYGMEFNISDAHIERGVELYMKFLDAF